MLKNKLKLVLFTGIVFAGLIYADDASADVCNPNDVDYSEIGCKEITARANNEHADGEQPNAWECPECVNKTSYNTETHLHLQLGADGKEADIKLCSDTQYNYGGSAYQCSGGIVIPGLPNALNADGTTNTEYQKTIDALIKDVTKDGDWNTSSPLANAMIDYIYQNTDCGDMGRIECAKEVLVKNYYEKGNDDLDIVYDPCLIINTSSAGGNYNCIKDAKGVKGIAGSGLVENMCSAVFAGTVQKYLGVDIKDACKGTGDIDANWCTTQPTIIITTPTTPTTPNDDDDTDEPPTTTRPKLQPPTKPTCADGDCNDWPQLPLVSVPEYPTASSYIPSWTCGNDYSATLVENGGSLGDPSCGESIINTYSIQASAVQNNVNVKAGHSFDWGYTNGRTVLNQGSTPGTRAAAMLQNALTKISNLKATVHNLENRYKEWQYKRELAEYNEETSNQNAEYHEKEAEQAERDARSAEESCAAGDQGSCGTETGYWQAYSEHQRQATEWSKKAAEYAKEASEAGKTENDYQKAYNSAKKALSAQLPKLEADVAKFKGCVDAVNNFQPGIETRDNVITTSNEALTLNGYKQLKGTALAIDKNTGNVIYEGMTYDNGFTVNKDSLPANSLAIRNALNLFFVPIKTLSGTYKNVLTEDIFIDVGTNGLNFNMLCNLVVDNKTYVCTDDDCPDPPPTIVTCSNPPCPLPVNLGMNVIFRPISLTNPFPDADSLSSRERVGKWSYDSNVFTVITNNRGVNPDGSGNSYDVYNKVPMYTITLTPTDIKEIREYNKTHSYNDFDMSCDDGLYCKSNFIWTTFNKIVDYSNSCAMDSDWYACDGLPRDFMEGYYHYLK